MGKKVPTCRSKKLRIPKSFWCRSCTNRRGVCVRRSQKVLPVPQSLPPPPQPTSSVTPVVTPPATKRSRTTPPSVVKQAGTNAFGGFNIQPQRTLFGSTTTAVCTPKHVYRAFGMHRQASKQVKRSWNHRFTGPIEEMSTRNRGRLLSMAVPMVEKMLRAFSSENWASLLYYISNNVMLHQHESKRSNKSDRMRKYHDVVYQKVLARSKLVKHIVDGFNNVKGNTRRARDERRRLLSTIALDFPFRVIRELPWQIPDVGTKVCTNYLSPLIMRPQ